MRLRDFVGNMSVVDLLRRRRLPQSALFAGPEGVGKKTLALALACLAQCQNPQQGDSCGRCGSCTKAEAGYHPDILLFEPEKNLIRTEAMREMSREVQFRPFQGRLRFFVVDRAEKMNEEAANSILKTLEEPPETSRLVLVTAFPERLLATIRSRCQRFAFRPLSRPEMEDYLRRQGMEEDLELRAAFADGSIGKALALDVKQLQQARALMLDLLQQWCRQKSFAAVYDTCERGPLKNQLKNRESALRYLEILTQLGEDLYFLRIDAPQRAVHRDALDELRQLSAAIDLDWVRDFLYHTSRAKWEIEHYVNPLMCFETLWLKSTHVGNRYGQI